MLVNLTKWQNRVLLALRRLRLFPVKEGTDFEVTVQPGFYMMKAMDKRRTHSVEFKRQVSQECLAGETLRGLSSRHDISRQFIRVWGEKYQASA